MFSLVRTVVAEINKNYVMYPSVISLSFLIGCLSMLFRKAELETKYYNMLRNRTK